MGKTKEPLNKYVETNIFFAHKFHPFNMYVQIFNEHY